MLYDDMGEGGSFFVILCGHILWKAYMVRTIDLFECFLASKGILCIVIATV